jgi:hypothetical protein
LRIPYTSDSRFFFFSLFFVGLGCLVGVLLVPLCVLIFVVYHLFKRVGFDFMVLFDGEEVDS